MKKLNFKSFGAFVCFAAFATSASPIHAQDDAPEPAAATEEDFLPILAAKPNATGAHEPTAAQRNQKTAATIKLALDGKALVPIVIAQKASAETRRTAGELAEFLGRIAGAKFEVQTPDGKTLDFTPYAGPRKGAAQVAAERRAIFEADAANLAKPAEALPTSGIVLGSAAEWQTPASLREGLAITIFDGREAYAIRTDAKRVFLLAAESRGVPHAAFRMLDELGCRWFATGENWEVIPSTPNLAWNQDITDRPTIGARSIAFMDGAMSNEIVNGKTYSERLAHAAWTRRNSLGASLTTSGGNAWHRIADENNDVLLEHPEYFAEVNGKRQFSTYTAKDGKKRIQGINAKFELANPAVRKMFIDMALKYFRDKPDADMISLSPTDGGGFSQSEESKKLGSVSDAVYGMVNEVARAVAKEFPGKMVGIYAYRETAGPPSFALEPNVYIEIATLFNMSQYTTDELFTLWPKKARNIGVYRYFSYFDADGSQLPGGVVSSIKWTTDVIRGDVARNTSALFAQSSNAFGPHVRGYWLATKLMWNHKRDENALLADFYQKAYGPAAPVMQHYHEITGRDSGKILTDNLLGTAFRDVDEATRLAKDRPDVLARLGDLKMYLRWIHLGRLLHATPHRTPEDKVKFRAAYVAAMQQAISMRHSYMAQWNMIADRSGRNYAALFKDISYVIKAKRGKPGVGKFGNIPGDRDAPNTWEGWSEPTPESIEANFQESLKMLPTTDIPEKTFNTRDLVPVVFPASPLVPLVTDTGGVPTRNEWTQSSSPTYIFYSLKGEPIEVSVAGGSRFSNGTIRWSLRRFTGTEASEIVAQGEAPSDKQAHALSIKVPAKGAYVFHLNARNQGGNVIYRADRPASVIWNGAGAPKNFAAPFFYVPKETKEIWYFFNSNNGAGNTFLFPDGKTAHVAKEGVNTIPVPAGMDGKVWSMSARSAFRTGYFFNIPNVAAASPDALMVPREVAAADGLQIRQ